MTSKFYGLVCYVILPTKLYIYKKLIDYSEISWVRNLKGTKF